MLPRSSSPRARGTSGGTRRSTTALGRAAAVAVVVASCSETVNSTEVDAASTDPYTARTAIVSINYFDDPPIPPGAVWSAFREGTRPVALPPGRSRVEGPCSVTIGPSLAEASAATPTTTRDLSAGEVSVSDGRSVVTLLPGDRNDYLRSRGEMPAWVEGARLTVTGSGAEIPPFTTSVVTPSRPAVTFPATPRGGTVAWTRGSPFMVRRVGSRYGSFFVYISYRSTCKPFVK